MSSSDGRHDPWEYRSVRTGTETRTSTERTARPQMSMNDTCSDKFQEQIQGVLEFVVHTCRAECCVHSPCQGGMCMGV